MAFYSTAPAMHLSLSPLKDRGVKGEEKIGLDLDGATTVAIVLGTCRAYYTLTDCRVTMNEWTNE